jgi:hypothetical protein
VQKEKHAMGSLVQATKCEDFQWTRDQEKWH